MRIIEISLRHATEEGSFRSAMHLPETIAKAGFNVVYALPWMKMNRRASLSPYAVADYHATDELLGSKEEATDWIHCCHDCGLDVVLDIPLNHTSPFHNWLANEGWYARNKQGRFHAPLGTNWKDVFQLNHNNPWVSEACREVLEFWLDEGVDGFRLDAASFISNSALKDWYSVLSQTKHVWCDESNLASRYGFFTSYLNHRAFQLAESDFDAWQDLVAAPADCGILYLSNHDTLHAGLSPREQWKNQYDSMKNTILNSKHHCLLSWSDWKDSSMSYSFLKA